MPCAGICIAAPCAAAGFPSPFPYRGSCPNSGGLGSPTDKFWGWEGRFWGHLSGMRLWVWGCFGGVWGATSPSPGSVSPPLRSTHPMDPPPHRLGATGRHWDTLTRRLPHQLRPRWLITNYCRALITHYGASPPSAHNDPFSSGTPSTSGAGFRGVVPTPPPHLHLFPVDYFFN